MASAENIWCAPMTTSIMSYPHDLPLGKDDVGQFVRQEEISAICISFYIRWELISFYDLNIFNFTYFCKHAITTKSTLILPLFFRRLYYLISDMGLSDTYGFLCPQRIAHMPHEKPESQSLYIAEAMVAGKTNRMFFGPYNTGYVFIYMLWINLVFISTYYKFPQYDLFSCIGAIGHWLLSIHWRILFIGLIRYYMRHVTILWTSSRCEFNIRLLYFLLIRSHPFTFFY